MVVVRVRSRVKIAVRIRARVKVRVRVRVSVSYIMTIWRWEEFSRCDKFPTTPSPLCSNKIIYRARRKSRIHGSREFWRLP